MILRRNRTKLVSVIELDQLVSATPTERERLIGVMPVSVVRALLLYVVNRGGLSG